jgi:hypothetical protein
MRAIREKIITDRLDESDWNALLALNLKPVHKAYLKAFRYRDNAASTLENIWLTAQSDYDVLKETPIGEKPRQVFFDQVSNALKNRGTPYRIRSVLSERHEWKKYRIVKVAPA